MEGTVINSKEGFFNEFYAANYTKIMAYISHIIDETHSAEDLAQEVFLVAYRKIDVLANHENPVGWLYSTAKNIIKAFFRKKMRLPLLLPFDEQGSLAGRSAGLVEIEFFSALPSEEALLLKAHHLNGFSVAGLARLCCISETACKQRLKRARDKLLKG